MQAQFERFKDASWFPQKDELVMIGGAGGTGSWLCFFLNRAGFKCTIYDFDIVDAHNLGGQLFRQSDIKRPKVVAVQDIVQTFCNETVNAVSEAITEDSPTHYFMFSAFDNMKARKILFNIWKKSIPNCPVVPVFIDGRLEAEQLQIFCVTPDKIEEYEKHLFDDSEVPDAPCTLRQTSHSAAMIATHMTGFFTNHIANIYQRDKIRIVPFYYEYFIPANLTEEYE